MKISRRFTVAGQDPYEGIAFDPRTSEIRNPDGTVVFRQEGVTVPSTWSSVATDVLAQKYFRRKGVPQVGADGKPLVEGRQARRSAARRDARQVFHRLAGCWRHWGETHGYFDTTEDAQAFYDEMCRMLADQRGAPNSPQWFNTGLHWAYGIDGPAQGHLYVDPTTGEVKASTSAYERPQPHACFIQSVARRPRERGRHHGPLGPRGAPLQVRLAARAPTSRACAARTSRSRAAASRRA